MTFHAPAFFGGGTEATDVPAFGFAVGGLLSRSELNSVEKATGVWPRLVMFYLQWPSDPGNGVFPELSLRSIGANGALPILSWEPMFFDSEKHERMIAADSIIGGRYDTYLQRFARESRRFGKPYLIRFAHEMNLERYHWGSTLQEFGPESAAKYRAMFRHIVEVFRAENANNVGWVFCPNADSVPDEPWNRIESYYPGDDVVDVIGLDGYNWGTSQTMATNGWNSEWRSFESIFAAPLQELRQITSNKPAAVFETSSAAEGGNKETWILAALDSAKTLGLIALVWFELDKEVDWRLETSVSPAVREVINRKSATTAIVSSLLRHAQQKPDVSTANRHE
ncbi:MAG TPA: glycosyl hydrolase [Chthoniobacterales bacterium]|nr:glycosyl hydrolase [Chthoniobacterales bacterium]